LKAGKRGEYPKHTLLEALTKFREEIAPLHKGKRWEEVRTRKFERYPIAQKLIGSLTDDDMALWRGQRLQEVSSATVRREMVLWGQVFEAAREVWRWVPKNIMRDVKKPSVKRTKPKPVPQPSIDKMVKALGSAHKSREVALGFLLGCETAMRPWEMVPLVKYQVDSILRVCHLEDTKNGDDRDVPLTPVALEILAELGQMNPGDRYFTVAEGSISKLWADARLVAGITGLHFRHSRREGIRRLSKRLGILDLARAVGHRDLNSLQIYYQESAAEMAKKLDPATPSPSPLSSGDAPPPRNAPEPGTLDR
jgi:integrase